MPTPDTLDPSALLDEIEARANAATPGPWSWRNTQSVYLQGARTRIVMAFRRMGMSGAQPEFRSPDGLLYPVARENINDFPDAAFIAHARQDVPALTAALRAVLALHGDAGPSQGYTQSGYGWIDHCCATCGSFGEYGEEWPCKTHRAITAALSEVQR